MSLCHLGMLPVRLDKGKCYGLKGTHSRCNRSDEVRAQQIHICEYTDNSLDFVLEQNLLEGGVLAKMGADCMEDLKDILSGRKFIYVTAKS